MVNFSENFIIRSILYLYEYTLSYVQETSCKLAAALDNKRVTIATNYTYDLSLNKVTNEYIVETPISWLERARLTINATTQAYRINYKLGLEHNLLGTNKLQIEATTGEENRLRLLLEAEKSDWKRAEFEILTNERMIIDRMITD